MTADGRHFETRERAVRHIFKMQEGRSGWTDYIYLSGSPRWRVYENGAIEEVGTTSHATMKTEDTAASTTGRPSKERLQQAAKWIRRELTKRADGSHPSHLAAKVLEEADEKFKLGSFGVEGWAKSPSLGYQYLNYGDSYDPTIIVRSNPTRATVIVALGGWASYA